MEAVPMHMLKQISKNSGIPVSDYTSVPFSNHSRFEPGRSYNVRQIAKNIFEDILRKTAARTGSADSENTNFLLTGDAGTVIVLASNKWSDDPFTVYFENETVNKFHDARSLATVFKGMAQPKESFTVSMFNKADRFEVTDAEQKGILEQKLRRLQL